MAAFTENPKLTDRYAEALTFAFNAHRFQIRKQGEIPYVSHLMAVSGLVLEAGGSEDEAIAALLHDYIEDVDPVNGFSALKDKFGVDIASTVQHLSAQTNDEYLSADKVQYLNDFGITSVFLVSAADKLHNLRGYSSSGRSLWKPAHADFYNRLLPIYKGCDYIPQYWIEEMQERLVILQRTCSQPCAT